MRLRLKLAWNALLLRPTMVNLTIQNGTLVAKDKHTLIACCRFLGAGY